MGVSPVPLTRHRETWENVRAKKGCTVEGRAPCSLAEEETRIVVRDFRELSRLSYLSCRRFREEIHST